VILIVLQEEVFVSLPLLEAIVLASLVLEDAPAVRFLPLFATVPMLKFKLSGTILELML